MADKNEFGLARVQEISGHITDSLIESGKAEEIAMDVAFHMLDWHKDLLELLRYFKNPSEFTAEQVNYLLLGFLTHAPHHLVAASMLHTGSPVRDVFEIGAVESGHD
jgi:hypothetical protein